MSDSVDDSSFERSVSTKWSLPLAHELTAFLIPFLRISRQPMSLLSDLSLYDITAIFVVLNLSVWLIIRHHTRVRRLPLPPGPSSLPLIGNVLDFPDTHEGRFWAKHKDLYGALEYELL